MRKVFDVRERIRNNEKTLNEKMVLAGQTRSLVLLFDREEGLLNERR